MKHFLLFYDVTDDYPTRRALYRDAHLEKAWAANSRGELVLGGAFADPVDGTMLIFAGESREVAESFAQADPYVINGLVKSWRVREWTTVIGALAMSPVRPASAGTHADSLGDASGEPGR